MSKNKVTKVQIKKERSPEKIEKVLKQKGYPRGNYQKVKFFIILNLLWREGKQH